MVHVLAGSANGVTAVGSVRFSQDTTGIADVAESGDHFGLRLTTADYNGDGRADLTIGAPGESYPPDHVASGIAHVLFGSSTGLKTAGSQVWMQGHNGIGDHIDSAEEFGD